jgi:hypothetical protein
MTWCRVSPLLQVCQPAPVAAQVRWLQITGEVCALLVFRFAAGQSTLRSLFCDDESAHVMVEECRSVCKRLTERRVDYDPRNPDIRKALKLGKCDDEVRAAAPMLRGPCLLWPAL